MLRLFLLCILLIQFGNAWAVGQLLVTPASTTVVSKQSRIITIKNTGDAPIYVNVSLFHVENPGLTPEIKTSIQEMLEPNIIASPTKISLGPGQSREVKLVGLNAPVKETVYRLYVLPVSSFNVIGGKEANKKISAPTVISVGYGVLVRVLPDGEVHQELTYECKSDGMLLINNGNTRADLMNVTTDDSKQKAISRLSVYPSTPVHFSYKSFVAKFKGKEFSASCK
ncbi:hypothetical protein [Providencia sp. Je.9.19]|uniref:hypothetical protein n=1 Tax=unclassified Providencia TaxID=2633465 RepID=UPI003DA7D410